MPQALPDLPGTFYVVVMTASVGGLAALSEILGSLPADFKAAIAVVQHRGQTTPGMFEDILNQRTALCVRGAREGDRLEPGVAHVAPYGLHLVSNPDGSLSLSNSPKVKFARPAGDRLFESAAMSLASRVIGVVLTGGDGDGSDGIQLIKEMGGMVIAQDQSTSKEFSMPRSAIETGDVDFILPLEKIAPALMTMVGGTV